MADDVFADRRKPRALTGRQKGSEEAEGEGKRQPEPSTEDVCQGEPGFSACSLV